MMENTVLVVCVLVAYSINGLMADYPEPKKETALQPCYSCNSASALCREEVYDGTYLTKTPCSTKCFVRREGKEVYRGCFDGWMGGLVRHNYDGCRTQKYLGQEVEWCFCKGSGHLDSEPCNALSRKSLGSNIPESAAKYTYSNSGGMTVVSSNRGGGGGGGQQVAVAYQGQAVQQKGEGSAVSYQSGMPVPDYKQYMSGYAVGASGKAKSYRIEAKEGPASYAMAPRLTVNKYKIECYECHDGYDHCGDRITRPDYVAVKGCKSHCFIRKERNNVYRGCFDGWLKTSVNHDYSGCRVQDVYGTRVEWCFCQDSLCNARSLADLGEMTNSVSLLGSQYGILDTQNYVDDQAQQQGTASKTSSSFTESETGSAKQMNYPSADEFSTFKNLGMIAREGAVISGDDRFGVALADTGDRYGVADVYDNNVYNYAPEGNVSPPNMCHGLPNGVYTDPFDCTMYINCLNGYTYRRRCAPGTAWNQDAGLCDYADKVAHLCQGQYGQQQHNTVQYAAVDNYANYEPEASNQDYVDYSAQDNTVDGGYSDQYEHSKQ